MPPTRHPSTWQSALDSARAAASRPAGVVDVQMMRPVHRPPVKPTDAAAGSLMRCSDRLARRLRGCTLQSATCACAHPHFSKASPTTCCITSCMAPACSKASRCSWRPDPSEQWFLSRWSRQISPWCEPMLLSPVEALLSGASADTLVPYQQCARVHTAALLSMCTSPAMLRQAAAVWNRAVQT
jgi:hypothetical protein